MDPEKLFDIGFSAVMLYLYIRLDMRLQKLIEFQQAILSAALDSDERDRQAARERKKLGRAVGIDLEEDTQGKRPAGFDTLLEKRRQV